MEPTILPAVEAKEQAEAVRTRIQEANNRAAQEQLPALLKRVEDTIRAVAAEGRTYTVLTMPGGDEVGACFAAAKEVLKGAGYTVDVSRRFLTEGRQMWSLTIHWSRLAE